jgi:beta-lactamase superfamily II metal-dependent hydrolase
LQSSKPLEIYFIDVGQGDSTFIVTPRGRKILIDGGMNRRALGFLVWFYRLDQPGNSVDIDLLVLSHADGDHLEGLIPIVEHPQINVQRIVHNGIATFQSNVYGTTLGDRSGDYLTTWHDQLTELTPGELSDSFREWRRVIVDEHCQYGVVNSQTGPIPVGDDSVEFEVLGPRFETLPNNSSALRWLGNRSHTINGHSVVNRLNYRDVSIFLSGDLNIEGSEHLLSFPEIASRMSAHILKVPHHGSHEFYSPLLESVRPQISAVSSGDGPDHGHPRANLLAALGRA